jgi:hypothetical protein
MRTLRANFSIFMSSLSDLNDQPIVSEDHAGWERGVRGAVVEVVADVSEEGAPGPHIADHLEGLLDREVGGVWAVAKGVEDEERDAVDGLPRRRGD